MTQEEPKVSKDGRYEVRHIARVLDVGRSTVYDYEKRGLITFRTKKSNGRNFLTGMDILKIWKSEH